MRHPCEGNSIVFIWRGKIHGAESFFRRGQLYSFSRISQLDGTWKFIASLTRAYTVPHP
jgi:hypothetical protein